MNTKTTDDRSAAWHRIAEDRVTNMEPETPSPAVGADARRMLHELMEHKVELELQNEELLETRAELEFKNDRLTELYDFAPVGYFSVSETGIMRKLNLIGARLLGEERAILLDGRFVDFLSVGSRQAFDSFLSGIFSGVPAGPCEVKIMGHRVPPVIISLTGLLSSDHSICRMVAMDVTDQRLAEAVAHEKNEDLERIFNLASDLMGVVSMDGCFVTLNPAFGRLLGHPTDELIGKDLFGFLHPDDVEATREAISLLKQGNEVVDVSNRQRCRDGTYRWLEWSITPFRGELICALGRDITTRKQTEDALRVSEEKFRSIVETSPMAMYLYQLEAGERLMLIGANPAADEVTGIEHGALHGKTVEEAFPMLAETNIPEMYKDVARGKIGTQSFVIHYNDDRIRGHFDVRVFRTGPGAIVVAFSDISDRIRTERELKRSQDELEFRVGFRTAQLQERTLQLRALADELIQVEEGERRRIAAVIHDDLQQTLVAATLALRMLKANLPNKEAVADVEKITDMLSDSIAISRSLTVELSPPVLQQCGLAAAFNWLRTWCMDQYGLAVTVDADEDIDPGLELGVVLFRAVRELLFNTVKHSGVKSASLQMERTPDGGVRIEVIDHGSGFDPVEVRAREGSGGGFGLFNIRERLELFGGWFKVESSPGAGSRFRLWVPMADKDQNSATETTVDIVRPRIVGEGMAESPACRSEMPAGDPRRIRIIIADDHSAVRDSLARVIDAEADLEVIAQAEDGEQAVELARHLRPDFVLMDLNMPRMGGIKATALIRKTVPCVQVLGLSTHADEEHRAAMIRAGALDLLHKNNSTSGIFARLRGCTALSCCPCETSR